MKIVHLDTESTWRGGERQVLFLCEGLRERGVETHIITQPGSELTLAARALDLPYSEVPMHGEFDLSAARKIRSIIKSENANILHMHTGHAVGLGMLAFPFPRKLKKVISRRVDFPIRRGFGRMKYTLGVSRILCVSEGIRQVLMQCGVPGKLATTIHSGINLKKYSDNIGGHTFREEMDMHADQPLIVNVAALVDHKGQRYLVDAASSVREQFPDVVFVIAGEGPMRGELEEQIKRLGLRENVRMLGHRKDITQILAAADLFALPSHLEGLCTSLLDAMAMRLPIVATLAGGIPEAVVNGKTGYLVEPRNSSAFGAAINLLLSSPEVGKRMGQMARERVAEMFSSETMVENTLHAYRELG
jgi:L-malate glycosyltransferase